MKAIKEIDRYTGIITNTSFDGNGNAVIKETQDIDAIVKETKAKISNESANWTGDMHHVASIPMKVVDAWRQELKAKGVPNPDPLARVNQAFFIAKINSSDFKSFRTKSGRI